jgi:xanthine/uracil permease
VSGVRLFTHWTTPRTAGVITIVQSLGVWKILGLLIAEPFSKIIHLFPRLVTGTVITIIGLSLINAGVILVLLGIVPKLGEVIAAVPGPVIGGAALVMFAAVTAVGIRSLRRVTFDGTDTC